MDEKPDGNDQGRDKTDHQREEPFVEEVRRVTRDERKACEDPSCIGGGDGDSNGCSTLRDR